MTGSSYRPITDVWLLARSKVKYWGAYPAGFLGRARALLGVGPEDSVLHVCGGKVRDYPFAGFGPNDKTLDLDPTLKPDFCRDANKQFPGNPRASLQLWWPWSAILIDAPYTPEDADEYKPGREALPKPNLLLKNGIEAVRLGGRIGFLHYIIPKHSHAKLVAVIGVVIGFNNRIRVYSVHERVADPLPDKQQTLF